MRLESCIKLLGHSIESPKFINLIRELNLVYVEDFISYIYSNNNLGIFIELTKKRIFENEYGVAKSSLTSDEDELIIKEVTFEPSYAIKNKLEINLPYNLKIGDTIDEINQKLNKKPTEKSEIISYGKLSGYSIIYFVGELRILIILDENKKFIWTRFWLIELSKKYAIVLKKSLAKQNKNLTIKNIELLIKQKEQFPSREWQRRMLAGDDELNAKDIESANIIFNQFIDNLRQATIEKKASKIYSAIKKIVLSFNKVSHFIETLEREELVDFIHSSVKLTGFVISEEVDLTSQWREW